MSKKSLWIAALSVVAIAAAFLAAGCSNVPDNAAATVNGKVITKDEVADRIRVGGAINPASVPSDTQSEEFKRIQSGTTEQMVAEEVEMQEAEKRGITVTPDEIEPIVDQVIEDKYLGSLQKMQEDFAKRGLKEDDLRKEILRRILHQKVLESLRGEVPVSDAEVQAQYDDNKGNYVYPEKRQVRQVVLADEATANSVMTRIAAGEDMAVIAGQSSIDSKTKTNGGLVGLVPQAALPKAVGDVAFSLPVHQVSTPFKADLGWYVVRVELITPASNQTFDSVKDDLRKYMSNQKLAERYKVYVEEVKAEYDIEYADDYAPREHTETATTSTDASVVQP
ncbi:MAG: peptidyl-prolyl cis-trans isomerase [Thermoleophilia bacterium]|jgi:parvulin-like peptidyl-prolyl isomerase